MLSSPSSPTLALLPVAEDCDVRPSSPARALSSSPGPSTIVINFPALPLRATVSRAYDAFATSPYDPRSWKCPAFFMKHRAMLIALEIVVVVYFVSLVAKLRYYGQLSSDKLFTLEFPFSGSYHPPGSPFAQHTHGVSQFDLNVMLVNTPNYHFEVYVPVVEAFEAIENVNLTLVTTHDGTGKWGLENAINIEAAGHTIIDPTVTPINELGFTPDLIFLTTCPEDLRNLGKGLTDMLSRGAHVMCIVHQAHLWDYQNIDQYADEIAFMRPWIERNQWHFAAISRHVHTYIRQHFPAYLDTPDRDYRPMLFHPVFNLTIPRNMDFDSNDPFAVIPGKFESERRNYDKIFTEYGHLDCDISLRLVGSGKIPEIADAMSPKIGFITNLNFYEFFTEMAKGIAIIPTLGNEHYLQSQASSSVATSVISGTPLIANAAFMNAHTQIPLDAVWLQGEGETELQVLQRVGHLSHSVWRQKKNAVERLKNQLLHENVARAERFLNILGEARYRII
ncbi:uncharacterized protein V1518DRAFT_421599 [Limtongia smithiae]|uniref:uncharacterized protein n=1 Tax=Limtongia smithiae TaxID=1125753 RepID=UPI0034CD325B